jgi:hypothetical protein
MDGMSTSLEINALAKKLNISYDAAYARLKRGKLGPKGRPARNVFTDSVIASTVSFSTLKSIMAEGIERWLNA